MVRDNRHDSVCLFGAICHARGAGAAIIMPTVNTEAMNEDLKEISTQVAPAAHAVLICDCAGWHQQGKRLRTPHNITLLRLPPYAPVNPMENIWDYLCGNKLSSLVWDSYEAIVAACKDAWEFLIGDPERIDSIARQGHSVLRPDTTSTACWRCSAKCSKPSTGLNPSRLSTVSTVLRRAASGCGALRAFALA
jgi:DDE superfamily endonuclease